MKVVQINTVCGTGSTGKIAADICRIGKKSSYEMYVAYGRGNSPQDINGFKIGNRIDFLSHVLVNFVFGRNGFASKHVTKKFLQWLDHEKPDIIHLHNIHGFYIHIEMLFSYIKEHSLPVVWTFHDCWPLTGQCAHFDYIQCEKWQHQCYKCPIYRKEYPYSLFHDNSKQNYIDKKSIFNNVPNLTIVTPSQWLADIVSKSYLCSYPCKVISNGINLETFKPSNDFLSQTTPKIILGVANVWTQRKGLNIFYELAHKLPNTYQIVLIGVTNRQKKYIEKKYSPKISAITRTNNQSELAEWYSRATIYVNPTFEDTFPTTNLEALACGTPVITFNTGGSPESLNDSCGIIVEKGNVNELINAILSLENNSNITRESCRLQSLKYDRYSCFQKYIELYAYIQRTQE